MTKLPPRLIRLQVAASELWSARGRKPTRKQLARKLDLAESTVKRYTAELNGRGLSLWPAEKQLDASGSTGDRPPSKSSVKLAGGKPATLHALGLELPRAKKPETKYDYVAVDADVVVPSNESPPRPGSLWEGEIGGPSESPTFKVAADALGARLQSDVEAWGDELVELGSALSNPATRHDTLRQLSNRLYDCLEELGTFRATLQALIVADGRDASELDNIGLDPSLLSLNGEEE